MPQFPGHAKARGKSRSARSGHGSRAGGRSEGLLRHGAGSAGRSGQPGAAGRRVISSAAISPGAELPSPAPRAERCREPGRSAAPHIAPRGGETGSRGADPHDAAAPRATGEAGAGASPRLGRGQRARLRYPAGLHRKPLCCAVNIEIFFKKKSKLGFTLL